MSIGGYIHVLTLRVGDKEPKWKWLKNDLETLQKFVGGYIETVSIGNAVVICNEEGLINGMHYNTTIAGFQFFGDIIIAGVKGDEFDDLTPTKKEAIFGQVREK